MPYLPAIFTQRLIWTAVAILFLAMMPVGAEDVAPTVKPVVFASHASKADCYMNMGPMGAKAWMRGYHFVVMRVDQGSPSFGILQPKDVVVAADGKVFGPENDSRITLGNAIGRAEAEGKPLRLRVKRAGKTLELDVSLPQLGAFSATWPAECPKSAKILDAACRSIMLAQLPDGRIVTDGNMGTFLGGLLLLASGNPRYLDAARRAAYAVAAQEHKTMSLNNWNAAYGGLFLSEYYLATGDDSVLPAIKSRCDQLAEGQMRCGSWGHTTPFGAYGALNQVGVVAALSLVLANECGVEVDQAVMKKALDFFARFAERGAVPYGDNYPYNSLDSNGRNATCAILMHLAGRDTEADALAQSVAMSYWEREEGHTGGFFSVTWGPLAAIMAGDAKFRQFMDYQKWFYNLTRDWRGNLVHIPYHEALTRFDGNAYIEFGGEFTTGAYGLVYALPKKKVRVLGAPKSVFSATSKPGGLLAQARKHYLEREWIACDKVLAQIKAAGLKSKEETYWYNQLEAARALTIASNDRIFLEIESNLLESAPYRASEQFQALKRFMGKKVDPRFEAVEKRLSGQSYGIGEGKKFYDAWATMKTRAFMSWTPQGKLAKELVAGLPTLHKPIWEPLSAISNVSPQPWKTLLPEKGQTLPVGWNELDFDDAKWIGSAGIRTVYLEKAKEIKSMDGRRRRELANTTIAARRTFTLEDNGGRALKLRLQTVRPATTKVYLNGHLIANSVRGQRGGYASISLDDTVIGVLRKGKNVLAVTCDKQGQSNNHLDVGLYVNRDPVDTQKVLTIRPDTLALDDVTADATLRVRETKDKMKQAWQETIMSKALPELVKNLSHPVGAYRYHTEKALVMKGVAGVEAVAKLANAKDWKLRSAYCAIVGGVGREAFRSNYREGEKQPSETEKMLMRKSVIGQVPRLIERLKDQHFWVRLRAASALGGLGSIGQKALPQLTSMIRDPDPWVRIAVIGALDALQNDPEAAVAAAVEALKVPNTAYSVLGRVQRMLKKYPEVKKGRLNAIVMMLRNPPEGGGGRLLKTYMQMGVSLDPQGRVMVPVLADALVKIKVYAQQQANPRATVIELLIAYGDKAKPAIPALKALLSSKLKKDRGLHKSAIEALRAMGVDVSEYEAKDERK